MSRTKIIALSVLAAVVLLAIPFGVLGFRALIARPTGAVQLREKTQGSGDFRLTAYEHFFDLNGAIKAYAQQIHTQADAVSAGGPSTDWNKQVLVGLRQQCESAVAQYNADAAKYTRGQFRDNALPDHVGDSPDTDCQTGGTK